MSAPERIPPGAIAVTGMACRYPGADTVAEFWRNIAGKVESIRFFGEAELADAGVPREQLQRPNYVRAAGVLDDIAGFDAALFGISPREARVLDPQHRVFLECCWAALEDASIDPSRCRARIGVFAGCNLSSYALLQLDALANGDSAAYMEALVGNDKDYLSTRVSYRLDLRGPSVTVGTACSTSLSAIALACQSLQAFGCDVALAGGVCINVPHLRGYQYGDGADALSIDGHCRAFDAAASGTAPGHGAGVVVLRRLEDALAGSDSIYAVIRGFALGNDGSDKVGYWAPSVAGHAETVSEALAVAGVNAREIGYVEAHGTGTPMGDPIEVAALTTAFRADTADRGYCALGSVKTNIGHTSQAAGVAGLIKTVLALEHGQLPPSLHFQQPNPKLQLPSTPFYVNTELRPWPAPRRAGVSSLGLGGTNVHVVLEQAPAPEREPEALVGPALLPLSANSEAALDAAAARLLAHLEAEPATPLASVASALQRGRRQLPVRGYVVAESVGQACERLRSRRARWARRVSDRASEVVFVFPGASRLDGPALQRLAACFPELRAALLEGIALARALDLDLSGLLEPGAPAFAADGGEREGELPAGVAALLVVEVALARLLRSWGIVPAAVLGHSSGEYAAACVSGALELSGALQLQVERARLFARLPRRGAMLSVNLPAAEIERRLGEPVAVSAFNADDVTLLAGDADRLATWATRLSGEDVVCRPSAVLGAAHSSFVDPVLGPLRQLAARVPYAAPTVPWISTATGTWMAAQPPEPEHWVRHTRDAVRFVQAVVTAASDESRVFLEVGPGGHLTSLVQRIARTRGASNHAFSSMPGPNTDAAEYMLGQVGRLWALGTGVDLAAVGQADRVVPARLPSYPFEHVRHWIDEPAARPTESTAAAEPSGEAPFLYRPVWVRSPLPPTAASASTLPWVLRADGCALCDALAEHAEREGRAFARVAAGDDAALWDALRNGCRDGAVLLQCHAGASAADEGDALMMEPARLARGLQAAGYAAPLTWVLLTAHAQPVLGAEDVSAAISGMATAVRVLPRELPNVRARWIDVDPGAAAAAVHARCVAAELDAEQGFHPVAYRYGQRWEREFRPLAAAAASGGPLREGGRYLVTGGLGRMGLSLAQYLTELPGVRVALTYTRELPPPERWPELAAGDAEVGSTAQIVSSLLSLRARGARLELARIDAADEPAMGELVAGLSQRWGGIDGVFHFAATLEDKAFALLADAGPCDFDANRGPKLRGAQVLARLAERHRFEFCFLASSLSSEFGGLGNFGYAATNRALDVLAERLDGASSGGTTRWLAVNFDYYRPQAAEDGRSDPREQRSGAMQKLLIEGALRGRDLMRVIERALPVRGAAQVIACGQPIERHVARFPLTATKRQGRVGRPDLSSDYCAPTSERERELVEIWQELLAVEPIGVQDNFFELGGDSLMVLRMTVLCRERLGSEVPIKALLGNPTIEQLALALDATASTCELFALRAPDAARHSVFCVPYAGGSALGFKRLAEQLPEDIGLWVLPAAREVADVDAMLDEVARQLAAWPGPFSVYGHCGGSFAAVELARRLERAGRPAVRVFAAATLPPEPGATLSADAMRSVSGGADLVSFMQTLGGLPESANESDARAAAAAMHDDGMKLSAVFERFRAELSSDRLRTPLSCLFGAADPMTADWERRACDWQLYFERVDLHVIPGAGHYFVHAQPEIVAALLQGEIERTSQEG